MIKDIKQIFGIICKVIASILICAGIGYLLLLVVFSLPTEKIESNVKKSVPIFQGEQAYPYIDSISGYHLLDNYTDALMILSAAYQGSESLIDRSTNVYHAEIDGYDPSQVLVILYSGYDFHTPPAKYHNYARYWHGYLTILKPLLCFMDYGMIRYLNTFLFIAVAGILLFLLYKKHMTGYIIPYLIILFMLDPFAIANSLQYSSVYYIASVSSIILLLKMERWGNDISKYIILFTITGCLTSYFDLLTYPLITLGIPAILFISMSKDTFRHTLTMLLYLMLTWSAGYFCMWGLKWIIGSLLTSGNLISDALSSAIFRVSMDNGIGESISLVDVLKDNLKLLRSPVSIFAFIYAIILAIIVIVNIKRISVQSQGIIGILYLFIGILPVIWYIVFSNHSYIHNFFTYRELTISVFALLCMLTRYISMIGLKKQGRKEKNR